MTGCEFRVQAVSTNWVTKSVRWLEIKRNLGKKKFKLERCQLRPTTKILDYNPESDLHKGNEYNFAKN